MRFIELALAVLLLAGAGRAQAPPAGGDVRSLEGTEQTQIEGRAQTDVPGTVTDVDARTGVVTVRAAGAALRVELPPAKTAGLRPGAPVTIEVVLVARGRGGGPAPPETSAPGREVRTPSGNDAHGVNPEMIGPRPER